MYKNIAYSMTVLYRSETAVKILLLLHHFHSYVRPLKKRTRRKNCVETFARIQCTVSWRNFPFTINVHFSLQFINITITNQLENVLCLVFYEGDGSGTLSSATAFGSAGNRRTLAIIAVKLQLPSFSGRVQHGREERAVFPFWIYSRDSFSTHSRAIK